MDRPHEEAARDRSDTPAERATPAAFPLTPPQPPRRRWPWAVAVVALLALTASAGAIAWEQRETARAWQQQAELLAAQGEQAVAAAEGFQAQVETLEAELAGAVTRLDASEADVANLEDRLRSLADERAQAEDELVTGAVERLFLQELAAGVAEAVTTLDACIDRLFALQQASVEAFNRAASGETVAVEPLNAQAAEVTRFCATARAAAADAGAAADALSSR